MPLSMVNMGVTRTHYSREPSKVKLCKNETRKLKRQWRNFLSFLICPPSRFSALCPLPQSSKWNEFSVLLCGQNKTMHCKFFIFHSCPGDKILEIESPGQSTQQSVMSSTLYSRNTIRFPWLGPSCYHQSPAAGMTGVLSSISFTRPLFVCVTDWTSFEYDAMNDLSLDSWIYRPNSLIYYFPLCISTLCVSGSNILVTQGWLMHWKGDRCEWSSLFDIPLPFFSLSCQFFILFFIRVGDE